MLDAAGPGAPSNGCQRSPPSRCLAPAQPRLLLPLDGGNAASSRFSAFPAFHPAFSAFPPCSNIIRLAPPLVINEGQLHEATGIIKKVFQSL